MLKVVEQSNLLCGGGTFAKRVDALVETNALTGGDNVPAPSEVQIQSKSGTGIAVAQIKIYESGDTTTGDVIGIPEDSTQGLFVEVDTSGSGLTYRMVPRSEGHMPVRLFADAINWRYDFERTAPRALIRMFDSPTSRRTEGTPLKLAATYFEEVFRQLSAEVGTRSLEYASDTVDTAPDVDPRWRHLVGPMLDQPAVVSLLRADDSEIDARRERGELLAVSDPEGERFYPVFQFDPGVSTSMPPILQALLPVTLSPWTVASWLRSPHPFLDNETPLTWLRNDPQRVLVAARRDAERLDH